MIMHTMNPTLTLARESGIRRKSIGRIKDSFICLAVGEPAIREWWTRHLGTFIYTSPSFSAFATTPLRVLTWSFS